MIKNVFTRVASLLLVLVMLLALIPSSVLGASQKQPEKDPEQNGTVGEGGGDGTVTGGTITVGPDLMGMRFSLYWGKNYDSFKKVNLGEIAQDGTSGEIIQIGRTIDVNLTGYGGYTPTKASHQSVFVRMSNNATGMNKHEITTSKYDTSIFCYTKDSYTGAGKDVISKIPNLLFDKTMTKEKLDAFFLGSGYKTDPNNKDYTNTNKLIEMMIHNSTFKMKDIDFANGRYTDAFNQTKSGVYKLFYEPILYFKVNSVSMAVTLRDAIAYSNHNSKFLSVQARYMYNMANAVFLEKDEKAIGMDGLKTPLPSINNSTDYNKVIYPLVKEEIKSTGRMYTSMGVGVVTGGDEDKQGPQIIKTYVYIDTIDENGNITYKKADPSKIETATFITNDIGNLTQIPHFSYEEPTSSGIGILNDIFSVPADLTVTEATEWVNTPLITSAGKEITSTSKDIAGYAFGLVTDSDLFIENYKTIRVNHNSKTATNAALAAVMDAKELAAAEEESYLMTGARSPWAVERVIVKAVPYVYERDINLGRFSEDKKSIEKTPLEETEKFTPANNIVLRYIVTPTPAQYNVIEIVDENSGTSTFVNGGKSDLVFSDDSTVVVQTPDYEVPSGFTGPELIEWVTNNELPIKDISTGTLPIVSENGKSGSEVTIMDYPREPILPTTHNLYIKWKIVKPNPDIAKYQVPEWRLSKFWKAYEGVPSSIASMSLPVSYGCHGASLSPSGAWNYTTRNPNGLLTLSGHSPINLRLDGWIHSETVHSGKKPSISIGCPSGVVPISGNINAIKDTENSGLKVANWLDKASATGLASYDIKNDFKGNVFTKNEYLKNTVLGFGVYNINTYTNRYKYSTGDKPHRHNSTSRTLGPNSASYGIFPIPIEVTFDRYLQQNTDAKKLLVNPVVTSNNTKTTLKYQLKDTYKIYPEYGMLFANDNPDENQESIKWVVGDQARLINPVVYQTLEHKVYVTVPTVSGTQATDSRAISNAKKLGESGKPVYYKGAAANPSFNVLREQGSSKAAMLTVKTFTLDFKDSVKSAWGNSSYKSQSEHDSLVKIIDTQKTANATEKLLIDSLAYGSLDYTGAEKRQSTSPYEKVDYSGKTVTVFTHELIVRGGTLIGAKVMNRNNPKNTPVMSIAEIKAQDPILYEAIINMDLYNEANDRSKTIFSTFEHQTGDVLNEGKYGMMLSTARNNVDGIPSSISTITEGKGWYSEDTTVLVIKEYVTNYNVPSISFSDKISMSVKGLDSPINKNEFFSVLGRGYTYLKYDLPIKGVYPAAKVPDTSSYFEYSSLPNDPFDIGEQKTNYLVPNATAADAMSIS